MTERFTTLEKTHFDHADLFRISVSNYARLNVYGVHVCRFVLPAVVLVFSSLKCNPVLEHVNILCILLSIKYIFLF